MDRPLAEFFPGFRTQVFPVEGVNIHAFIGGAGPPLLLIHGAPQSAIMWQDVALGLAKQFTVIAPDLRGYGRSDKPAHGGPAGDYSKRRMAADMIAVMTALGHARFFLAGHDRGARVARRLAKDHPNAVEKLAILDIVPTAHIYANLTQSRASNLWHWFALIQTYPAPELLLGPQAAAFVRGAALLAKASPEAVEDYVATNGNAEAFHAMCQDYRAGAGVDQEHDAADAQVKLAMPTLVLWGERSPSTGAVFDVAKIWESEAHELTTQSVDCGHFLPEEKPAETLAALLAFFGSSVKATS
jgi:haloacetate dehalogenase